MLSENTINIINKVRSVDLLSENSKTKIDKFLQKCEIDEHDKQNLVDAFVEYYKIHVLNEAREGWSNAQASNEDYEMRYVRNELNLSSMFPLEIQNGW